MVLRIGVYYDNIKNCSHGTKCQKGGVTENPDCYQDTVAKKEKFSMLNPMLDVESEICATSGLFVCVDQTHIFQRHRQTPNFSKICV